MKLSIREMAVFAMLGALMFASKLVMEVLPNVHLLGTFIVALTVVYRWKALYPLYIYVFINGLYAGFATWWIPYLYVWAPLWAAVMLLPRNIPQKWQPVVYAAVYAAHGFLFGLLYAPGQMLLFGWNFRQILAWVVIGFFPADFLHGVSNLLCGALIVPLITVIRRAEKTAK